MTKAEDQRKAEAKLLADIAVAQKLVRRLAPCCR